MRRPLPIVILLVLVASSVGFTQTGASTTPASAFVIRAGILVDPDSGTTKTNQTIVVQSGKISAVGSGVAAPPGATVIHLSRFTVLPGVFDATHLCMDINLQRDGRSYFYTTLQDPDSYRAIKGRERRDMLQAGFRAGCRQRRQYACGVRRAIEQGRSSDRRFSTRDALWRLWRTVQLQPDKRALGSPVFSQTHATKCSGYPRKYPLWCAPDQAGCR
jgi:hypothetical protein